MRALMVALVLAASPAAAEVVKSDANGFVAEHKTTIDASAAKVWETLRSPQRWWAKEHTWSGDPANLYIDAQATGCFCERLPDRGSVEHAHIVYAAPNQLLRMSGALGPLQVEAASGTLSFSLVALSDSRTQVTVTYVVGGYVSMGMEAIAAPVDQVIGEQLANLRTAANPAAAAGPPAPAVAPPPPAEKPKPGGLELDLSTEERGSDGR